MARKARRGKVKKPKLKHVKLTGVRIGRSKAAKSSRASSAKQPGKIKRGKAGKGAGKAKKGITIWREELPIPTYAGVAFGRKRAKRRPRMAPRAVPRAAPRAAPSRGRLIRTGVKGLDALLGGGIPEGASVLVTGLPHCGKKPMLMQMGYRMLKEGKPVIFVLTDFGVKGWKETMDRSGWGIKKYERNTYFVDCYSQQFGVCPKEEHVACLQVPFLLSTVSIETSNFINEIKTVTRKKPVVIVHSLSTLVQDFGEIEMFKFVQFFVGRMRAEGATLVMTIQSGVRDERTAEMLEGIVDYVVEMRDFRIRASGFGATGEWAEYKMSREGIVCCPPEKKKEVEELHKELKKAVRR